MQNKHWSVLVLTLAFLGAGCTMPPQNTQDTKVNNGSILEEQVSREEADAAFDEVAETIKPSENLSPVQESYSIEDRLAWYEKLNWSKECEADFRLSSDKEDGGLAFYKITDQTYVLRADCYAGAYQKSMIFALATVDGEKISGGQLEEQVYDPQTKTVKVNTENDGQFSGLDSFDAKNKTLTIYAKDRGVGDCGSRSTYRLKNYDLELIKVATMSCEAADEFHLKNPDAEDMPAWPVIYEKK